MEEVASLIRAGLASPAPAPQGEVAASKDAHINLRIAAPDKKIIEGKAARAGLKTGEFIRRAALGKVIVERVPLDLRREIGSVGNNLNQLVRLANAGKLPGVGIEALNELVGHLLATLR